MESPRAVDERARRAMVEAKKVAVKKAAALKAKQKDELTWSGGGVGQPDNTPAGRAFQKNLDDLYADINKKRK
jgi:hypothetical protein